MVDENKINTILESVIKEYNIVDNEIETELRDYASMFVKRYPKCWEFDGYDMFKRQIEHMANVYTGKCREYNEWHAIWSQSHKI